jgi:transposase-like protein
MRDVIRCSEAFKLRLVEDVAAGKYRSLNEASRRNGICGCATLRKWMKQYGREDTGTGGGSRQRAYGLLS